ncbi:MAG: MmgE/PrpD family protein [Pseudomonadota bacterium]
MSESLTHRLSRFICHEGDELAPPVTHEALRAILDTLAVTLAGGKDEAVRCLEASLDAGVGACPSPWSGQRYGSFDAAMLYGMASHMDDYDDVSMLAICHPSAPVLSALVAAELSGSDGGPTSGRDFVTAFSVGTEVTIRLGQAMGFRHYELGFHATATLGVVGVAAAVARRARLDQATTRQALAIAASMASGIRKNFGSPVKPLHVGLAAAAGLRAVRMARAGVTAASEAFEHGGYLRAYSGGETDTFPASGLDFGRPFVLGQPGFEQKRYACCYMLHKTIEAALALRREGRLTLADVARAHVNFVPGATKPLIHPRPRTGLHGKFSAPYAVLASLADGRIDLASFTDAAVLRPELQSRLGDMQVVEEGPQPPPGADLGRMPLTLTLTLRDGRTLTHTVHASPGSPEDPLTLAQLREKWVDCLVFAKPALDAQGAGAWFDQGLALDRADSVRPWLARIFAAAA